MSFDTFATVSEASERERERRASMKLKANINEINEVKIRIFQKKKAKTRLHFHVFFTLPCFLCLNWDESQLIPSHTGLCGGTGFCR